jgi:CelD/BcsL family acetyltransferase involved in cellulose biosynthesis
MEIQKHTVNELPSEFWLVWDQIQQLSPELGSPFFSPEFAQAVGSICGDTEVGVLFQQGKPVGFFPFHRGFLGIGQPLGRHLSDFQAVIAFPHAQWTPCELIRGCGLRGWDFDHISAGIDGFARFTRYKVDSPFIDVSNGFQAYENNRKASGSNVVKNLIALGRKLEREVGPMRFEYHCPDLSLFQQMMTWKKDQYKRTGVGDVFASKWTGNLLTKILHAQTAGFAGVLSGLWAGEQLIAVHMGMRSRTVWHYWFPTYDPAFSRYSPGMLLLLEMIKTAQSKNLSRIDLGKGDADYKTRLMTGATPVLEGSIIVSAPISWARRSWLATKACLRGALRIPVGLLRNWIRQRGRA